MVWLVAHEAQAWSLAVVLFGALVSRLFRLRARLTYSFGHSWDMLVDQPLIDAEGKELSKTQIARTASITVRNTGLLAAKAVEVTFNWRPMIFNVWPARSHSEATHSFDRYSLKFDSLAPGEQVTIEIMSINRLLPEITAVRSDDIVGKKVQMTQVRALPGWVNVAIAGLIILGASTAIYEAWAVVSLLYPPSGTAPISPPKAK